MDIKFDNQAEEGKTLAARPAIISKQDEQWHIRSHAGTWFATHADVARYVKQKG